MLLSRTIPLLALLVTLRARGAELKLSLDEDANAKTFPAVSGNGKEVAVVFGNRTPSVHPPVILQVLDVQTGQQVAQIEILTKPEDRMSGETRAAMEKAHALLKAGHFKSLTPVPAVVKGRTWKIGEVTFDYQRPSQEQPRNAVQINRGRTPLTSADLLHVAISPACAGDDTNLAGVAWVNPWLEKVWFSAKDQVAVFQALTNSTARDGCEGEEHYSAIKLPP